MGEYCDETFVPGVNRCSFRFCAYVPADPNGLSTEVEPAVSCTDNTSCQEAQYCNASTSTCYVLPSDGGNGWAMGARGNPVTLTFPQPWAGRFWPRTGCDPNSFACATGECVGCTSNGMHKMGECTASELTNSLHCTEPGQPATLAEVNMIVDTGDFYDVSNVDGANVGVEFRPDPATYDVAGGVTTDCTTDADCTGTFACDPALMKCVNPFFCGSPGCRERAVSPTVTCEEDGDCGAGEFCDSESGTCWDGCAASGFTASLLQSCNWDPASDLAVPETECDAALRIESGGNYAGCLSPTKACAATNPPALDCASRQDLYGCTGPTASVSCFSDGATDTCCGCPSWADAYEGVCQSTNPTWGSEVEPLLAPFNSACPTSYSFPFDDAIKLFSCEKKASEDGIDYRITFCPQRVSD